MLLGLDPELAVLKLCGRDPEDPGVPSRLPRLEDGREAELDRVRDEGRDDGLYSLLQSSDCTRGETLAVEGAESSSMAITLVSLLTQLNNKTTTIIIMREQKSKKKKKKKVL